jgi:hypothetical protein
VGTKSSTSFVAANQKLVPARVRLQAHRSGRTYQEELAEVMPARVEMRRIGAIDIVNSLLDRPQHRDHRHHRAVHRPPRFGLRRVRYFPSPSPSTRKRLASVVAAVRSRRMRPPDRSKPVGAHQNPVKRIAGRVRSSSVRLAKVGGVNGSSVTRIVDFTVVVAALTALTGCGGGSGTTALHGTFTDLDYDFIPGHSCQVLEARANSDYQVTVAVDNIPAASVAVIWHGSAYATQGSTACAGTWAAKVTSA